MEAADFSGYATKNSLKCTDGRTITPNAFKHNHQQRVPLVWQHQYNEPGNILGYAILEHRDDGTYTYGFFNETDTGQQAKQLVQHGDITMLSIYANQLVEQSKQVLHGEIKEVSLVLSGANPGARIDNVNIRHSDGSDQELDDEAIIFTGLHLEHADDDLDDTNDDDDDEDALEHADEDETVMDVFNAMSEEKKNVVYFMIGEAMAASSGETTGGEQTASGISHADDEDEDDERTVQDIFDEMTEKEQTVAYYMIGEATADSDTTTGGEQSASDLKHNEGATMTRNVFDQTTAPERKHLTHAQISTIINDGIKGGSFKESFLQHAGEYGITDIELLFPDAKATSASPELLARQAEWVPKVLGATKHAPFAKIKSIVADLTAAEARAKGYIKGNMKKEEVVKLLKRSTGPTTVYKKQKLDRDDLIDITDFDVIAWLKWEIRFMLNEELARAILVGDGRSSASDDKVKDPEGAVDGNGIRSILHDHAMYAHPVVLAANVNATDLIDGITRARTEYRGSGSPSFYRTDKIVTDLLLLKDKMGRRLYETEAALASALRVKEIVTVEVMEETANLVGIVVNLVDFTVGANKGGELSFFEDFDIDFNQNKYLLETRVSGALTRPKAALVITREQGTLVAPTAPSFNGGTNTITVPNVTGVDYVIDDVVVAAGAKVIVMDTEISAVPEQGYYFAPNTTASWNFTFTEI